MAENSFEKKLKEILHLSLKEDIPNTDITTTPIKNQHDMVTCHIIAKEDGIFFGQDIINHIFELLDPETKVTCKKNDGTPIRDKDHIATIQGKADILLKAERTLLNFIQHLSGIATSTHQYVQKLNNPKIKICDTRKTTPNLRFLEKKAVLAGGGYNHRENLSDAILIKENHLCLFFKEHNPDQLPALFKKYRTLYPNRVLEIEIESCSQLKTYDLSEVDIILLDNFKKENLHQALDICKEKQWKAEIEISGNISINSIALYTQFNIQRISIGKLTHSVKALDLSLIMI